MIRLKDLKEIDDGSFDQIAEEIKTFATHEWEFQRLLTERITRKFVDYHLEKANKVTVESSKTNRIPHGLESENKKEEQQKEKKSSVKPQADLAIKCKKLIKENGGINMALVAEKKISKKDTGKVLSLPVGLIREVFLAEQEKKT